MGEYLLYTWAGNYLWLEYKRQEEEQLVEILEILDEKLVEILDKTHNCD